MVDDVTFDVHPSNWVGANLLGISLMEVRENLRNQGIASQDFSKEDFEGFYGYYFSKNSNS